MSIPPLTFFTAFQRFSPSNTVRWSIFCNHHDCRPPHFISRLFPLDGERTSKPNSKFRQIFLRSRASSIFLPRVLRFVHTPTETPSDFHLHRFKDCYRHLSSWPGLIAFLTLLCHFFFRRIPTALAPNLSATVKCSSDFAPSLIFLPLFVFVIFKHFLFRSFFL